RCGDSECVQCWACHRCGRPACAVCLACESLGRLRECDVILSAAAPPLARPAVRVQPALPFSLTPAQADASAALARAVAQGRRRGTAEHAEADSRPDCLVWAACGAGKTEVSFGVVADALSAGRRVLFAVPRREVVRELGERLRRAFPACAVQALYGGSEERFDPSVGLTIATAHQTLRFEGCFDLVILDEADAYPYRDSHLLQRAVLRSRKPGGFLVYMTATPEPAWLAAARRGEMACVTIPARHHGHPMPVPEVFLDRAWSRRGRELARPPFERLREAAGSGPWLVFVPAVATVEPVVAALARLFGGRVAGTHGRDPDGAAKRARLAAGRLRVLVTTTVLERGVTIEGVQAAVLFADEEWVFDSRTLVQIAGRVGRSGRAPSGRVLFFARRCTPAMRAAVEQIETLNDLARRAGYLAAGPSASQRPPAGGGAG
ncbi:MAG TPA: DEAD/DEAH box helicase family protein, partial [Limnochordia bacterium]